ncbi:phosphoprotein associated with glycosphingolipid-enriched microdomains 1 isoform X2 [Carettochelys insculpta]|uniref:phosphoprotein associated with glycosphingolipid-enriched microdomains 1 isoform X2 n=1 Tax=Carettochelys insculpta TaxID=44489 RepID=UPI003EB84E94
MGPDSGFFSSGQLQVIVWGSLAAVTAVLFLMFLIVLCSSCDREKRPKPQNGDHENLMNVPSDKEMFSHSVISLATDPLVSSDQNGGLTNGDVLSEDSTTACIQPYEEVQTSVSDLLDQQDPLGKSIKCHQSRELPRIPPTSAMETILSPRNVENDQSLGMEGPYEVLKDSSSQENIVEDCLYETVKEIKEVGVASNTEKSCGSKPKATPTVAEDQDQIPECRTESAEYASVDRNKKSRQSANSESSLGNTPDMEDEAPPPVPMKFLDENENVQEKGAEEEEEGTDGAGEADKISATYSSVSKPGDTTRLLDSTYNSIEEVVPQRSPSICSGLYASVKDFENTSNITTVPQSADRPNGESEADYEVIPSVSQEKDKSSSVPNTSQVVLQGENDYESIGDLQQNSMGITRL